MALEPIVFIQITFIKCKDNKKIKLSQSSDEKRELSLENKLLKDQLYRLKQRVFKTKNELLNKNHSLNILNDIVCNLDVSL